MRTIIPLLLLMPGVSLAWGNTGHRTICQIAFDELTTTARTEVQRLIDLDSDFTSFAMSCTFADRPRQRAPAHFINLPRSHMAITTDDCPLAADCLFRAIEDDVAVLEDTGASDGDKLRALKLLGHWVGDIHQPLHISYFDDRGGNQIGEQGGPCTNSLHSAWDTCMIHQRLGTDFADNAMTLRADITEHERDLWQSDSPIEWANESYQITIAPNVEYCRLQGGACWYSVHNMILDDGEDERRVTIDRPYIATHRETIAERLKQAGVRLGAMPNELLQ
jgi:hypothetical protein